MNDPGIAILMDIARIDGGRGMKCCGLRLFSPCDKSCRHHPDHSAQDEATTMSNSSRTEAIGLVLEVRDMLRERIASDYMPPRIADGLVADIRRLDRALELLTEEA